MPPPQWIWVEGNCGHHHRHDIAPPDPCPYCVDLLETREAIVLDLRRPAGDVDEHGEAISCDLRKWPHDAA